MDGAAAAAFQLPWLQIILLLGVQISLSASQQGPNDVVVRVGDGVKFTYSDSAMTDSDYYYWSRYDPQPETIYAKGSDKTSDPNKYSVTNNGSYCLIINDVGTSEARTYGFYSQRYTKSSLANLVVIDKITPSVNPSDAQVGQEVNLTCVVQYGGPTTDKNNVKPLSPDQDPQLSMYIGNTQITDFSPGQKVIGEDESKHNKSISVNRTLSQSDVGQPFECRVATTNPSFTASESIPLNIRNPTTFAHIDFNSTSNNTKCCRANSRLNCTANGYPYPTIKWKNGSGNNDIDGKPGNGYSTVAIKEGKYNLICYASYESASQTYMYNDSIYVDTGVPQTEEVKKDNKVGLGVGIGVGIGVPVLVGLIVLIIILSRRRKKSAKTITEKQPETKTKTGQTGKAPGSNGKGPEPGSKNNVNPNPNPTYYTPVMPEQTGTAPQKNVRDSPGYGDLGVRHIGGSGSNPHLNESFDSQANKSFESSKSNRDNGNNLQFTAGKTNHSPSAPNTSV